MYPIKSFSADASNESAQRVTRDCRIDTRLEDRLSVHCRMLALVNQGEFGDVWAFAVWFVAQHEHEPISSIRFPGVQHGQDQQ